MITILLTVSRADYLPRVITCLELLECDQDEVNILCIVDGPDELFIKARNLVGGMKYRERLTVRAELQGLPSRIDITSRRQRISAIHNQARKLIAHDEGYVFSVEDDTIFGQLALERLTKVIRNSKATAFVEGVEFGRWGVPYVGAWRTNDVYETTVIKSIERGTDTEPIDAGGLYCALIRAELYKKHEFHCDNGLGPDVNMGLEFRRLGYSNYINWNVPCNHLTQYMGKEKIIDPFGEPTVITLRKKSETEWLTSY